MAKSIRGIDEEIFRKLKAKAQEEDRTIGELINQAMAELLDKEKEQSLNDYPAWDWGEDTEKLSENYRKEHYGGTA